MLLARWKDGGYLQSYQLEDRLSKFAAEMNARAMERTLAMTNKKRKIPLAKLDPKIAQQFIKERDRLYDEEIQKLPSLLKDLHDAIPGGASLNVKGFILANRNQLEAIAYLASKAILGGTTHAEDLLGSITNNKVGYGHTEDYYKQGERYGDAYLLRNAEAFANIATLHSSGHPLASRVLEELAPNSYTEFKKTLKSAGRHGHI